MLRQGQLMSRLLVALSALTFMSMSTRDSDPMKEPGRYRLGGCRGEKAGEQPRMLGVEVLRTRRMRES